MKIRELEYYILNEIKNKNFNNLSYSHFEVSETSFNHSMDVLKKNGYISGNSFESNGAIQNRFSLYYLTDKGEKFLANSI